MGAMVRGRNSSEAVQDCPECGGTASHQNGELVCSQCGLVLEEQFSNTRRSPSNTGSSPNTPEYLTRGLTTEIAEDHSETFLTKPEDRRTRRLRTWQHRIRRNSSQERNLETALNEIHRIASALGVPDVTRKTACVLYRRALEENLIIGYSIETIATASLHIACRKAQIPQSLSDFETVAKVPKKKIGRGLRHLKKELELEIPPADASSYIPRYCSDLDVDVDVDVERRARELLDSLDGAPTVSGVSPPALAGAVIYLAAQDCGVEVRQDEIATVAGVSANTISRRSQQLRQENAVPVS